MIQTLLEPAERHFFVFCRRPRRRHQCRCRERQLCCFSALLFTGVPPIPANATNTLAFCPVLRGRLSSSPTSPSPLVACLIPLALPLQQVTAREKPLSKAQQNQDLRTGSHRRFVAGKRRCVSWNADHQLIGLEVPLHGGRSGCNRCLRGLLGTSWGQEKLFGDGPEAAN